MVERRNKPARGRGKRGKRRKTDRLRTICGLCRGMAMPLTRNGADCVKTSAIFFPFDLFGSGGTRAGAELLADAVREMLADNRREKMPTRAAAYAGQGPGPRGCAFDTHRATTATGAEGHGKRHGQALDRRRLPPLGHRQPSRRARPSTTSCRALGDVLVVQFDAHLDIYHLTDCTEGAVARQLPHARVPARCRAWLTSAIAICCCDPIMSPAISTATSRPGTWRLIRRRRSRRLRSLPPPPPRVFLDLDCDVFDPAYFPGVGPSAAVRPEPRAALALPGRGVVRARDGAGDLRIRPVARRGRPQPRDAAVAHGVSAAAPV